jgi:hypothetical protein
LNSWQINTTSIRGQIVHISDFSTWPSLETLGGGITPETQSAVREATSVRGIGNSRRAASVNYVKCRLFVTTG